VAYHSSMLGGAAVWIATKSKYMPWQDANINHPIDVEQREHM